MLLSSNTLKLKKAKIIFILKTLQYEKPKQRIKFSDFKHNFNHNCFTAKLISLVL